MVVGIRRENKLFVPDPEDQLFTNDDIYIFSDIKDLGRTIEIFGKKVIHGEKVVLLGMGAIGINVGIQSGGTDIATGVITAIDRKSVV